jgi:predicted RNA-binding protein with PIN domain
MRTLIDGYNLMHELGLMEKRFGPHGFQKARTRFLNRLAAAIGAVAAGETAVVFDAREAPRHLPRSSTFKGMTIIFADDDEGADEHIERLIAAHSAPKSLTVISSDHRIRQAATRRKARAITADAFWQALEQPRRASLADPTTSPEENARHRGLSPEETAEWLEAFRDAADDPDSGTALGQDHAMPTDEEIARIVREVEEEDRDQGP